MFHLPCVNVLYERGRIKKIGGFDESFGSIIEDEDLSYHLKLAGFNFVYLSKSFVYHKMRDNFCNWAKECLFMEKAAYGFCRNILGVGVLSLPLQCFLL